MGKITFLKTMLLAVFMLVGSMSVKADQETYTYTTGDGTWITENIERLYQSTNFSFLQKKNTSSTNIATTYAELRVYTSHSMEVFPTIPGKTIASIEVTASSASYATAMSNATVLAGASSASANSVTGIASVNGSVTTFDLSGVTGCEYVKFSLAAQSRTLSWKVTYSSSSTTPTVATPTFNPAAGSYTSSQSVEITTTTPSASIYYTTDGSDPDNVGNGTLYFAAVPVNVTTTLKARAYATDMDPSTVATAIYTINPAPTITITEVTVPAFSAQIGETDNETINISGANLTADIILTIDGANADMFSVNSPLPSTGGVATIIYTPSSPGTHTATLKLNSTGATEEIRTLNGTATLAPPVATDVTGLSSTGFTANWNAVSGATEYELSVYTKNVQSVFATDLFFSEYLEGSSNNKALEIYNGTGAAVDLSQYSVELYTNGSPTVGTTLPLTGSLGNGEVYVIYNSGANAAIQAVGNVASTVTYFNGDDALALKKEGVIIDVFGRIGEDPGTVWGTDPLVTAEKTLVRKSTVTGGITTNPDAGFPALATEWDSFEQDYTNNIGGHTMIGIGGTATPIAGSPFTITGDITKTITGLTKGTTYYFSIVAKNGSFSSVSSIENSVTTSPSTGFDNSDRDLNVYTSNGKIKFIATANQTVEVFNTVGQLIVSKNTIEGLNTISVLQKGIVLVKVGDKVSKVIL